MGAVSQPGRGAQTELAVADAAHLELGHDVRLGRVECGPGLFEADGGGAQLVVGGGAHIGLGRPPTRLHHLGHCEHMLDSSCIYE